MRSSPVHARHHQTTNAFSSPPALYTPIRPPSADDIWAGRNIELVDKRLRIIPRHIHRRMVLIRMHIILSCPWRLSHHRLPLPLIQLRYAQIKSLENRHYMLRLIRSFIQLICRRSHNKHAGLNPDKFHGSSPGNLTFPPVNWGFLSNETLNDAIHHGQSIPAQIDRDNLIASAPPPADPRGDLA
jgi:hypothetical protein